MSAIEPRRIDVIIAALLVAIGIVAGHVGLWLSGPGTAGPLELLDPDSYMWLSRATDLAQSGNWGNHHNLRISPPEGLVQHWTRPMDLLLVGGASLIAPLLGFSDALLYWGVILPPLLHLVTLIVLIGAARTVVRAGLINRSGVPFIALAVLTQIGLYAPFYAGRPDHHALLAVLFALHLTLWLVAVLTGPSQRWIPIALGIVAGAAVWVNVAALLFVGLGMVGLLLTWISGSRQFAARNLIYGLSSLATVATALVLEWGPRNFPLRETDTLSIAHLFLFTLALAFWATLYWLDRTQALARVDARAGVSALGMIVALAVLFAVVPEFFGNPFGDVDPLYEATHLVRIMELQPLHRLATGVWGMLSMSALFLGTAVMTLPYVLSRAVRERRVENRIVFAVLGLALILYMGLTTLQVRWADYLALSAVLPFGMLVVDTRRFIEENNSRRRTSIVTVATLALISAPLATGLAARSIAGERDQKFATAQQISHKWRDSTPTAPPSISADDGGVCRISEVAAVLADPESFPDPVVVLAHTDYGPELLYRTRHSVLSIPNHRNQPGYQRMRRVFGEVDQEKATKLLRSYGIGAVALCSNDVASDFFRQPGRELTFIDWLSDGGIPEGFSLHAASPTFRVYRAEWLDG